MNILASGQQRASSKEGEQEVRLAHHKQSKKQVAIKTLKKKGISDEDLEMLLTEVQVIQEKVVCGVGALQNGLNFSSAEVSETTGCVSGLAKCAVFPKSQIKFIFQPHQ